MVSQLNNMLPSPSIKIHESHHEMTNKGCISTYGHQETLISKKLFHCFWWLIYLKWFRVLFPPRIQRAGKGASPILTMKIKKKDKQNHNFSWIHQRLRLQAKQVTWNLKMDTSLPPKGHETCANCFCLNFPTSRRNSERE